MSISYVVNCDECGVIICGDFSLESAIECATEDCGAVMDHAEGQHYTVCEECVKERDAEDAALND